MIKGINRQIIEITETGSIYYERALLVVRPEYAKAQQNVLEREAKRLVKGMKAPSSIKKSRAVIFWLVRLGFTALISCVLTVIVLKAFLS